MEHHWALKEKSSWPMVLTGCVIAFFSPMAQKLATWIIANLHPSDEQQKDWHAKPNAPDSLGEHIDGVWRSW